MFERYQHDRGNGRRGTWVRVCVGASAVAHVGVVVALVISSWWNIDKLSIDERPVGLASLGFATAAPPPLASESRQRHRKKLRRTEDLTQQTDEPRDRSDGGDGGDGEPDGQAGGKAGGTGTDPDALNLITGCSTAICDGELPPPPVTDPPEPPKIIPEAMLKGYLISGDTQIQAPDAVRVKIARTATRRVVGVVKLCIDTAGAVTSSSLLKSTGHKSYDRKLVSGVRRWRYRPYRAGGRAVAVCTSVRFLYILRD